MQKKYLNISDIASFIGQNPYDFISAYSRLYKKFEQSNLIIKKIEDDKCIQNTELKNIINNNIELKNDLEKNKITDKEYNKKKDSNILIEKQIINDLENIDNKIDDITLNNREKLEKIIGKETIKTIELKNDLSLKDKQNILQDRINEMSNIDTEKILKQGISLINTTYGTNKEESAIKMFEKKFKVKLDVSQNFNSKLIKKTDKYEWYICGKVDGLCISDNYIVEVKNRVKAFFNSLRDYEKTQIHLYMEMLSIPKAKLVEKFNNKIKITDIFKDIHYTNEIIRKIEIFIDLFEKFLLDDTKQKEFVMKNENEKRIFIQKYFFNIINYEIESETEDDCLI